MAFFKLWFEVIQFLRFFFLNLDELWTHVVDVDFHWFEVDLQLLLNWGADVWVVLVKTDGRPVEVFGVPQLEMVSREDVRDLSPFFVHFNTLVNHHLLTGTLGCQ